MNEKYGILTIKELEDKDFKKFKELIYEEAGIHLSDLKKALVQSRLSKRMRNLSLDTYSDYYKYLINNYDLEKINFVNAITTNKTDFFRENRHFEFIQNRVLPELEKAGIQEIRIWSAGCSSGEEPYTIAITLLEYFQNRKKIDLKILATDIDTTVLETAEQGVYSTERVEGVDGRLLKKYFLKGKNENSNFYKVKDQLKDIVYFRQLNLQDNTFPMKKKFNIIFCRNVIIYFDKSTQKRLFEKFYRYLDDYGYLFVGHSENISNLSDNFSSLGNTIYTKNIDRE